MKKSALILSLIIFLLTLSSFNPQTLNTNIKLFKIKNIEIDNLTLLDKKKFEYIFKNKFENRNIFIIDVQNFKQLKEDYNLIKEIKIKKIYPNKLRIKILEKNIIAIFIQNKKFYYLSEDGEKINFFKHKNLENLPSIIGGRNNFVELHKSLKKLSFPVESIKTYYYHEIGRWDIVLNNKNLIKLPVQNFEDSIKSYLNIRNDSKFYSYKVFDFRITNQLILR